jgi:hercynylcysteine S-oxide lyase
VIRWLYLPRGSAVFHVPARNQHLIRSCLPTSHGFRPLQSKDPARTDAEKATTCPFVQLFAFVATVDTSPYMCVPEALQFRQEVCGGEETIRQYCRDLAQLGGKRIAEILGTEVMDNKSNSIQRCCFVNIRLPFELTQKASSSSAAEALTNGITSSDKALRSDAKINADDALVIVKWIMEKAVKDYDTYLPAKVHAGAIWVRLSGQIYLELKDFLWAGRVLKELCDMIVNGQAPL